MEPVGIRNACTTSPRITTVRRTARTTASTYSRRVDLVRAARRVPLFAATLALSIRSPPIGLTLHAQDREERFLRDADGPDLFHTLLALALFLEQLPLPRDVSAVALGEHVLAHRRTRLPGDDLVADRRLDRDGEHLARDQLLELGGDVPPPLVRLVPVHDHREGVHRLPVQEEVHAHQLRRLEIRELVIQRRVAPADGFQP